MLKIYSFYLLLISAMVLRIYYVCRDGSFCFSNVNSYEESSSLPGVFVKVMDLADGIKDDIKKKVYRNLPSPHSELLLGMTLGMDLFSHTPEFKNVLKSTGTLHIVVVSGFNISLVYNFIFRLLGSKYKQKNVVLAVILCLCYCILTGFQPPVIRAWIMGTLVLITKYYGKQTNSFFLIMFTLVVIIIVNPKILSNMSFHLSFLATFGLVFLSPLTEKILIKASSNLFNKESNPLIEDLISTISAQLMVWPYFSYFFSDVNLISIIVNYLVLWIVPPLTSFGIVILLLIYLSGFLGAVLLRLIYFPLDYFVIMTTYFSDLNVFNIQYKINEFVLVAYYLVLTFAVLKFGRGESVSKKSIT